MHGLAGKISEIARTSLIVSCLLFLILTIMRLSNLITMSWLMIFGILVLPYVISYGVLLLSLIYFAVYMLFFKKDEKEESI